MSSSWFPLRRRRLSLIVLASLLVLLPIGCAKLEQTERELVFRIEPGTARWFSGLPAGVEDVQLQSPALAADESLHAWWRPAPRKDAPALLYLHGSRWNLTGQLFRIEQLHAMGFSVLAVDYRGFGQSRGPLPSERSVYQDALIAWEHLARLQPEASKRFIYGHSSAARWPSTWPMNWPMTSSRRKRRVDRRIQLHQPGRCGHRSEQYLATGALAAVAGVRLAEQDRRGRRPRADRPRA